MAKKISVPPGVKLTQEELKRIPYLKKAAKNAALYYLAQRRKS